MIDVKELLPQQQLALAYAPRSARNHVASAFLLENRLGAIVRGSSEPMIAQLKLAWWRDRFGQASVDWPKGEPLLASLAQWPAPGQLSKAVDGYEALLSERLDDAAIQSFSDGRSAIWHTLAKVVGHGSAADDAARAASIVSLADLANHVRSDDEKQRILIIGREFGQAKPLPRTLRSLSVLAALATRSLVSNGRDPAEGAAAYFTAIRVGVFGR